ncbi:hypothetical protein SLEP1_g4930 [Rubroshorea leprosula]|uniref:Uncharacterized protein n=1 Tax=Rubroshorea leprosula TaxID=152421 RepID=A0AAV5I116_9ROSI|nr:hypothetical protein SLEP1_g4930 [Rubroshorea leprosula]
MQILAQLVGNWLEEIQALVLDELQVVSYKQLSCNLLDS